MLKLRCLKPNVWRYSVKTPLLASNSSNTKSPFILRSFPTNKSPPVVVIPPFDASVTATPTVVPAMDTLPPTFKFLRFQHHQ